MRQSPVVDTSDTARTLSDGDSFTFSSLLALEPHGPDTFVGVSPAMGEMVVVTPQGNGTFAVAGRLPAP